MYVSERVFGAYHCGVTYSSPLKGSFLANASAQNESSDRFVYLLTRWDLLIYCIKWLLCKVYALLSIIPGRAPCK